MYLMCMYYVNMYALCMYVLLYYYGRAWQDPYGEINMPKSVTITGLITLALKEACNRWERRVKRDC